MFISVSSETQKLCYKCSYRATDEDCNVALCKGGWDGYFTMETAKDVEYHQRVLEPEVELEDILPKCDKKVESPLDVQVGGGHYKDFTIQPVEFSQKNQLNFCEGNIVKYACRHRAKGGVEDVRKIIHYAQLILQMEYGVNE